MNRNSDKVCIEFDCDNFNDGSNDGTICQDEGCKWDETYELCTTEGVELTCNMLTDKKELCILNECLWSEYFYEGPSTYCEDKYDPCHSNYDSAVLQSTTIYIVYRCGL